MKACLVLVLAGAAACASPGSQPARGPVYNASNGPMPDFHLGDVNGASPRHGALVSPGDYRGEVSAWYFGHST